MYGAPLMSRWSRCVCVPQVEIFDKDMLDKDDLIGRVDIPLLPLFKKGVRDGWVPIKCVWFAPPCLPAPLLIRACVAVPRTVTKWGREEHQGEIKLNLDFAGPPGVRYPQRQPEMDSFDEKERLVGPKCNMPMFLSLSLIIAFCCVCLWVFSPALPWAWTIRMRTRTRRRKR